MSVAYVDTSALTAALRSSNLRNRVARGSLGRAPSLDGRARLRSPRVDQPARSRAARILGDTAGSFARCPSSSARLPRSGERDCGDGRARLDPAGMGRALANPELANPGADPRSKPGYLLGALDLWHLAHALFVTHDSRPREPVVRHPRRPSDPLRLRSIAVRAVRPPTRCRRRGGARPRRRQTP